MEVASPLTFTPSQAGTKRGFRFSPSLVDGSAPAVGMDLSDDYAQQSCKRRRFHEPSDTVQHHTFNPFAPKTPSNGVSVGKRCRTEFNTPPSVDLNVAVQEQAQEIASLKNDKASLENTVHVLRTENEKVVNENKILKRAVSIQQERQNHAASEIQAARTFKVEAEDRVKKLEQMILTLRYHLQAQSSTQRGIDFMGFNPRPPDVY